MKYLSGTASERQRGPSHYRWQMLGLVLVGLLVLNLTAWWLSERLVLRSFLVLEHEAVEDAVDSVQSNLELEIASLKRRAHDNADRDETYRLLQRLAAGDTTGADIPRFFGPSRHVASALVDLQGQVLFRNPHGPDLPPGLKTMLPRLVRLMAQARDHRGRGGLLRTPQSLVLVGLGPVLPESGQGQMRGGLVFARQLDDEGLRKFRKRLELDFHLEDLGPGAIPAEAIKVRDLGQQDQTGTLALPEMFGYSGLRLVVSLPGSISRQGARAVEAFRGSILVASLLFGALALWLLTRIQVGQERRAERDRLIKNLLDGSGEGVFLVAAESGQVLSVNPRGAQMFGLKAASGTWPQVERLFREEGTGNSLWPRILESVAAQQGEFEAVLDGPGGEPLHVEVDGSALEQERQRYLLLVCRDVSRQKTAEMELQAAARRYRALFEGSPLPMWVFDDATRRFLDVNQAALAKYGYARGEFLALTLEDLHPPDEIPHLRARFDTGGAAADYAGLWVQRTRQGERLEVEVACQGLDSFAVPATLVLANDVTARRRAQRELLAAKQRFEFLSEEYRTVVETIPDQLSLVAPDLTVVWNNRTAGADECGAVSAAGRHDCGLDEAECLVRRCLASGEPQEGREVTGDGRLWSVRVFPLRRSTGELGGAIRLASDVTERVRLQQEAAQSSRLAALGELAAGVAHEINNPNGVILMNARLVDDVFGDVLPLLEGCLADGEGPMLGGLPFATVRDEVPQALAEIQSGARKIRSIVEDLKNFVRSEQPHAREPVDLRAVVEAALRLTANARKKSGARLETDLAAGLPQLRGSFQRLEQVVINLLLNACQALPEAGRGIRVALRCDQGRDRLILEIRDQGVGIAARDLEQIFDPFFTTKREAGGTGLGLSVSERIVREHGGTLVLASTVGTGTTATVTLPAASPEKEERP